jgi:hypothetical protein
MKNKFFFLGRELHKILRVNRPADLVYTWNYPKITQRTYMWSEIQKISKPAFTTQQVATLLNRSVETVSKYYKAGVIKPPVQVYNIETGVRSHKHKFYWHPEDVLDLHTVMCEPTPLRGTKYGRAGEKLPTRAEVTAMMYHGVVFYIPDKDGNFVPTWVAQQH